MSAVVAQLVACSPAAWVTYVQFLSLFFTTICYENSNLRVFSVIFYLSMKVHITKLTQWCTFWLYYLQWTSAFIVFIKKFLTVKCWVISQSFLGMKNLQKFLILHIWPFLHCPFTSVRLHEEKSLYFIDTT